MMSYVVQCLMTYLFNFSDKLWVWRNQLGQEEDYVINCHKMETIQGHLDQFIYLWKIQRQIPLIKNMELMKRLGHNLSHVERIPLGRFVFIFIKSKLN